MSQQATVNVGRALDSLTRSLGNLEHMTANIGRDVVMVGSRQETMDTALRELRREFDYFVQADVKSKKLQLAQTQIIEARDALDRDFGHYAEVRRRATGLLQARDEQLVTHKVIQETTEDVMIATPRYWLAPALVTLASWIRDDRELGDRSVGVALERDADKSSLFFALVLRRAGRDGVDQWLTYFLQRQNPLELERQFVVLLDAVTIGAFGASTKAQVSGVVDDWMKSVKADPETAVRERDKWHGQLLGFTHNATPTYEVLPSIASNWSSMESNLSSALCHEPILTHFRSVFEGEIPKPPDLETKIDDILTSLVSNFDEEELPHRRKVQELQAIIDNGGDEAQAKLDYERLRQSLDERVDFPTLLTSAAMHPSESSVSRGTQRLAVAMTKDWIVDAHDKLTAEIRSTQPAPVELSVGTWTGAVSSENDFEESRSNLDRYYKKLTDDAVEAVKFTGLPVVAAIGGVLIALLGLISLNVVVVLLGVAAGGWAFWQYKQLDQRREQVQAAGEQDGREARETLDSGLAELTEFWRAWVEADSKAEPTRKELTSLIPANYGLSDANVVEKE